MKTFLLFVGVLYGLMVQAQDTKDYVVLTNGDIISGKITEMNDTAVFINAPLLGDLVLNKSKVRSITLNSTVSPAYSRNDKSTRPNFHMPLYYKTLGVSINSVGGNIELGRRFESTRFNGFIKSGIQQLYNYDVAAIPIEVGFGLYHDTTKKSDFVQLHGGYAIHLKGINWTDRYTPSWVYGFDYRHVFVSRNNHSHGTYLEVGYEGGVLKRDFNNWWNSADITRVVYRNRMRIGFGLFF